MTKLYLVELEGKVSIVDCEEMLKTADSYKIDIFTVDPEYLLVYLNEEFHLDQFVKLVRLFEKFNGSDFEDYLQKVALGIPPEQAVKDDDNDFSIDDYHESAEEMEAILAFEKWAEEQTNYSEKIDYEYDTDNQYYLDDECDEIDAISSDDND